MKRTVSFLFSRTVLLGALALLCACGARDGASNHTAVQTTAATQFIASDPTETPTTDPTALPEPTPTPERTPTQDPAPAPDPVPTPFSIVWMSDTQDLTRSHPDVFFCMRDWILREREARNIVFLVHTGDVVDGLSAAMRENATEALMPLLETIPAMVVSGNHDIGSEENHDLFLRRPYAQAVRKEGQTLPLGDAAYAVLEAGGDTFVIVGVGYNVRGAKLRKWIEALNEQYPDAVFLYVLHYGLLEDGRLSGQAAYLVHTVIRDNPHARLMLCGHHDGSLRHDEWIDDDGDGEGERLFTTLMFNYQDDGPVAFGYMRILTFYPEDRRIEVSTYSPWYDQWGYPNVAPEDNAFVLENAY